MLLALVADLSLPFLRNSVGTVACYSMLYICREGPMKQGVLLKGEKD
jgi:hypothetical protein